MSEWYDILTFFSDYLLKGNRIIFSVQEVPESF